MKAYAKPVVSQIQLVMDQAILTACKTVGHVIVHHPYAPAVDCDWGSGGTIPDCYEAGS